MGNGQIDPLKEYKAAVIATNNGLSSHEKEYNKIHDDGLWDENIDQLAYEKKLMVDRDVWPTEKSNELLKVNEEQEEEVEEPKNG